MPFHVLAQRSLLHLCPEPENAALRVLHDDGLHLELDPHRASAHGERLLHSRLPERLGILTEAPPHQVLVPRLLAV